MKIFSDFNAKAGREYIFKPTTGNESLHKISNNGKRAANFATSKNLIVKSIMFPHHNIHYIWTSPDGKSHNLLDHILTSKVIQVYLISDHSEQQIVILVTTWWWQRLGRV
jgi:hypothetical protein